MSKREDRLKVNIDRDKEMRTKDISKMIGEGGLGADGYYEIKKESSSEQTTDDSGKDD